MKSVVLTLLSLITLTSYSQDLIILRNGERIDCKITKVDSVIIHYDFYKGARKLSSYAAMNNIRSYRISTIDNVSDKPRDTLQISDNTVIIDTTRYLKETSKWINMITFSQRFGIHANGRSLQYYGYNLKNTSRQIIPVVFGFELFTIHTDYVSRFQNKSVDMSYLLAGISPFYKLNDNLFLNFGTNLIVGQEELIGFYRNESRNTFWGLSLSQGIYFISKSEAGITFGLGIYEKLLTSEVFKYDIGIKLEIGLKF